MSLAYISSCWAPKLDEGIDDVKIPKGRQK